MSIERKKIRRLKLEFEYADGTVRVIELAEEEPGYVRADISIERESLEVPSDFWRVLEPGPRITLNVEAYGSTARLSL